MTEHTAEAAVAGKVASDKIHEFVNRRTQTGSAEAAVQSLVRRAYAATRDVADSADLVAHEQAFIWRQAASVATYGQVTAEDITAAVQHDESEETA